MSGLRRPWLTSLLALVLGLGGFGLMFSSGSFDDFSGWPVAICAAQLLWLWLVDIRGDHDDQRRLSLVARIAAWFLVGVTGSVVSAAAFFAALHVAVVDREPLEWNSMLAVLFLIALPTFALLWGRWAWRLSSAQAAQVAVRSMLARLSIVTLLALGLGCVANFVAPDSHLLLGAILEWAALIAPLIVLAWLVIPWLELLLVRRASNQSLHA